MNDWIVTLSNGARVVVEASSAADALREAEEQATRDGYGGLSAVAAERTALTAEKSAGG